jgi:hypothetical protein
MQVPQYITVQEVRRVCKALKISDWTRKKAARVDLKEARKILTLVNQEKMPVDVKDFAVGLEVELEHGIRFKDANVTNNHPVLTGMIVLAHLKESLDYYKLLEVAEVEGDLLKAVAKGDKNKAKKYYRKLAQARIELRQAELKRLK